MTLPFGPRPSRFSPVSAVPFGSFFNRFSRPSVCFGLARGVSCWRASSGLSMESAPRQHGQPDERHAALLGEREWPVEFLLLVPVEDDEVQPVLERLNRGPDRLLLVHFLLNLTSAHLHLPLGGSNGDLIGREGLEE